MTTPVPPRNNDRKELEYACHVLKYERDRLREHIRFLEKRGADLEQELALLRERPEYRWGQKFRTLQKKIARKLFRYKKAALMRLPLSCDTRIRSLDRLWERSREAFADCRPVPPPLQRLTLYKRLSAQADRLRLPADLPLTSVIILSDGDREHLARCRRSIEVHAPQAPFEILLTGLPQDRIHRRSFPNARLLPAPPGTADWQTALDLAAKQARGEYLLFLGAAAEVLPGWLDELALALHRHPEAGPVGAGLLHPDTGKLRSSGYLLGDDGTPIPQGLGADPQFPAFGFFRPTDFCSEAGFIIRKEHFLAAGGFDPADGNMAAAGLALRCRQAGHPCRIMPLAKLLLDREEVPVTEPERLRIAGLRSALPPEPPRQRIFYADAEVPMPDRGSGGMDAVFFMDRMVKAGYQVVFFGENMPEDRKRYEEDLERMGIEVLLPSQVKIARYLREHGREFDLVFVSRVYTAQKLDRLLRLYAPQAAYVFDTVDLHFIRERREADLANDDSMRLHALMTEVLELTVAARADAVIVISSEEKELLEREYGMPHVRHIPQARDCFGSRTPFAERRGIAFVGSAHPPNLDALKFYVQEILPRLEARGIDGTLTVIGEALRNDLLAQEKYQCVTACPKIKLAGYVEDLGTCFDHVRLTVAPLRYGAGTKGKVASSMAWGVPCVSTRFGTEGTGMIDGDHVRIADTPDAFADAMAELLTDEAAWRKISDGGVRFLREHYAPETVGKQTLQLLEDALAHKRAMDGRLIRLDSPEDMAAIGSGVPRPAEALRLCEPRTGAAILCETPPEQEQQELRKAFRSVSFLDDIRFAPEGKYDFILLARHPQAETVEGLEAAKALLYDGGRVLFPVPADLDAAALREEISGQIGFQQIFRIQPADGTPCLCAVKPIPYDGEGYSED